MSSLVFGLLCAGGGLVAGWFLLPAPAAIQKFWVDRGWVDRVP